MLRSMRTAVSSWTMKVLLGLLVLSFVSFYGWQRGEGCNPNVAAVVNGDTISKKDLENRFRNFVASYRNLGLLKENITPEMLQTLQGNVLNSMISQRLKIQEARSIGWAPSDAAVRDTIRQQFSDSEGNFDFELYQKVVSYRLGTTVADYENAQGEDLLVRTFDDLFRKTAFVTTPELRYAFEQRNDQVNLWYAEIDAAKVPARLKTIPDPKPAELQAYFDANLAAYQESPRRSLEIWWAPHSALDRPTDDELASFLMSVFPKKDDPSATGVRIRASHILLKTTPENDAEQKRRADEIYTRLKKGESFEGIARAESEDTSRIRGGDLGYFGRGEMVPAFEQAAYNLKPGEISQPVKSQFGYHVIRLVDRIEAGPITVERLKAELQQRWQRKIESNPEEQKKLFTKAKALLEEQKAKLDGAKPLLSISVPVPIRYIKTGFLEESGVIANVPDGSQLARLAFSLSDGAISEVIRGYSSANSYVVRIDGVRQPKPPTLESVRARVTNDWKNERTQEATRTYAKDLLAKWKVNPKTFEEMAAADGLKAMETGTFARNQNARVPGLGRSEATLEEAFRLTTESPYAQDPVTVDDRVYVVALKERKKPDWSLFAQEQSELRRVAAERDATARVKNWTDSLRSEAQIKNYVAPAAPPKPVEG